MGHWVCVKIYKDIYMYISSLSAHICTYIYTHIKIYMYISWWYTYIYTHIRACRKRRKFQNFNLRAERTRRIYICTYMFLSYLHFYLPFFLGAGKHSCVFVSVFVIIFLICFGSPCGKESVFYIYPSFRAQGLF